MLNLHITFLKKLNTVNDVPNRNKEINSALV